MSEILFKCETCNYETPRKDAYQKHLVTKSHKNLVNGVKKEDKHKCLQCNYESDRLFNLNVHIQNKHSKEKEIKIDIHKCLNCDYQSDKLSNVERHNKSMHIEKKINCEFCGISFIGDTEFNNHKYGEKHHNNCNIELVILRGKLRNIKQIFFNNLLDKIKEQNHTNNILVDDKLHLIYGSKQLEECIKMTTNNDIYKLLDDDDKNKFNNIYTKLKYICADLNMYEYKD